MDIGRLRARANVYEELPPQQDPETGMIDHDSGGWQVVRRIWGNYLAPTGKEVFSSGGQWDVTKASLRIRFNEQVSIENKIGIGGKLYSVDSVVPHENDRRYKDVLIKSIGELEP